MKHRRILWGNPQVKTLLSVLSYNSKYIRIRKSFSSQAIHLRVQSLTTSYRENRKHICLLLCPPSLLFPCAFSPRSSSCNLCDSHLTHCSDLCSNYTILQEWIPSTCKRYSHGNILATDSTLTLPLISTGFLSELTCMSYLWEHIQLFA